MLDFFLVLGQVPGTNYFLSFADVLWIALICLAAPLIWRHRFTLIFEWSRRRLAYYAALVALERQLLKIKKVNYPAPLIRRIS